MIDLVRRERGREHAPGRSRRRGCAAGRSGRWRRAPAPRPGSRPPGRCGRGSRRACRGCAPAGRRCARPGRRARGWPSSRRPRRPPRRAWWRADDELARPRRGCPASSAMPASVDEVGGRGEAELHDREQALAAGEVLALGGLLQQRRRRPSTLDGRWNWKSFMAASLSLPRRPGSRARSAPAWPACRGGVTPSGASASITALMTAGGEPMAPDLADALEPSGLWVHGVRGSSSKVGRSSARGMA